jgi:hypothetical protein
VDTHFSTISREQATAIRRKAYTVVELTKGLEINPNDRALSTLVELADDILILTNRLDFANKRYKSQLKKNSFKRINHERVV